MFTGIVEETGRVVAVRPGESSIRWVVEARQAGRGVRLGDSIAVNGCCLTVVRRRTLRGRTHLEFDLLRETWERTNLSSISPGMSVNLERSLAVGDRLGGHFVTGHIDGTGTIARWERCGADHVLDIAAPVAIRRQVVFKGSIAVDGISLTVAEVLPDGFRIWIIPHTQAVTALRERRVGDRVNLETDLLGKYVEQMLRKPSPRSRKQPANSSGRIGRAAGR